MLLLQAVAAVVLVGDVAEHARPREARVGVLVAVPHRRPADELRGLVAGHVAHLLDAEHRGEAVASGLDIGGGGEQREAAGCARAFVSRGGNAGEGGIAGGEQAAEMTLLAEQLGGEVADVRDFDLRRLEIRLGQPRLDRSRACRRRSPCRCAPSSRRSRSDSRRGGTPVVVMSVPLFWIGSAHWRARIRLRVAARSPPRARSSRMTCNPCPHAHRSRQRLYASPRVS